MPRVGSPCSVNSFTSTKPSPPPTAASSGDAHAIVRIINAQGVPADQTLPVWVLTFFQVLVVEPELCGVVLRPAAAIDAANIELPGARKNRALDGDAVSHLPLEALGQVLA